MPTISDLFVYPVKSCAGVRMKEVSIVPTGFEFDRNWMVVDADGNFVTQREHPTLALVKPQLNGGITLTAPDMEPLHLSRQWRRRAGHDLAVRRKARRHVDHARRPMPGSANISAARSGW